MAAPTKAARVKILLANSEPSTHGGKAAPVAGLRGSYWPIADTSLRGYFGTRPFTALARAE